MEHIDGRIVRHDLFDIGKGIKEELVELLVRKVVVLDFPGGTFIIHIVRRIGYHEVRFPAVHEDGEGFRFRGIAAEQPMPSERPHISALGEGGLFQFRGQHRNRPPAHRRHP